MGKNGKVYVVTGGAGGMGFAMARRLGKLGRALITDVVPDPLDKAAKELRAEGIDVESQLTDITDAASVKALAEKAASLGQLAGIAHTAGVSPTMADWKRVLEIDLIGTVIMLNAFLPLATAGTAVVCWSSNSAYMVDRNPEIDEMLSDPLATDFYDRIRPFLGAEKDASNLAYVYAKQGVILQCEMSAAAWGEHGARIVSISPGITDTAMARQEMEESPMMKTMLDMAPLGRMGTPDELAAAAEFLMSENASYITGADLRVDGGVVPEIRKLK